jgi:PTH1 family peptidyl-tRNA hydrolase
MYIRDLYFVKIIVGLGNPGEKYKYTRHNIGFIITGSLAEKYGITGVFSSKFNAIIGKGLINGHEALIIQPQTYMNLSGEAVSKVLNWYKLDISSLFVIVDDISIDFGKIRFRNEGSAGSHNGLKSIIESISRNNFPRLKVGIGPNPGEHLWSSYVLGKFSDHEAKALPRITKICMEGVETYLDKGIDYSMNKYNGINILEI